MEPQHFDSLTGRQRRHRLALMVHDDEWRRMHRVRCQQGPQSPAYRGARERMMRAWARVKEIVNDE